MHSPHLCRTQVLTVGFGLATAAAAWLICHPWNIHGWEMGAPFGRDFVNFWMAPRLVLAGRGAVLVDLPAYAAAIKQAFNLSREPNLLFVYPPHVILALVPFAMVPFLPAVIAWTALNLTALSAATRLIRPAPRPLLVVLASTSPPAVAMVIYGHFGGLLALASVIALTQSERRPWLSGLCLAFATVKPQYAAALGLILLLGGRWRCLLAAGVATFALVALSLAAFGFDVWRNFILVTLPQQSAIVAGFQAGLIETSISAYFSARFWGATDTAAWALQGAVAAAALTAAVAALRRGVLDADTLLTVLLAALVMQPYASHYDLAIVAPALAVVLFAQSSRVPFASMTYVLMPLARIYFLLGWPILGVLVPTSLFDHVARCALARRRPHRTPAGSFLASTAT